MSHIYTLKSLDANDLQVTSLSVRYLFADVNLGYKML